MSRNNRKEQHNMQAENAYRMIDNYGSTEFDKPVYIWGEKTKQPMRAIYFRFYRIQESYSTSMNDGGTNQPIQCTVVLSEFEGIMLMNYMRSTKNLTITKGTHLGMQTKLKRQEQDSETASYSLFNIGSVCISATTVAGKPTLSTITFEVTSIEITYKYKSSIGLTGSPKQKRIQLSLHSTSHPKVKGKFFKK